MFLRFKLDEHGRTPDGKTAHQKLREWILGACEYISKPATILDDEELFLRGNYIGNLMITLPKDGAGDLADLIPVFRAAMQTPAAREVVRRWFTR